jgi:hypothetical protein
MRLKRRFKLLAWILIVAMVSEVVWPASVYALTGGPSQPEVQSFEPIETSQMVDPFTGDFTYNIPLMDMDGYPINIAYHSGISMDQEASIVGLGWNLNPGVISRNMRGLPDDFNGDQINRKSNFKENISAGLNGGVQLSFELVGKELKAKKGTANLTLSAGISYNNYRGLGITAGLDYSFKFAESRGSLLQHMGVGASLKMSSQDGLGISPSISYTGRLQKSNSELTSSIGLSYNSRQGLGKLTFGIQLEKTISYSAKRIEANPKLTSEKFKRSNGTSSSISFANRSYTPQFNDNSKTFSADLTVKIGATAIPSAALNGLFASGMFSISTIIDKETNTPAYGYMFSHNAEGRYNVVMDFNREKDNRYIKKRTPNLPVTSYTHDLFSVSGQGVGGAFRPYRSDVGIVYDKTSSGKPDLGFNLGVELAVPNLIFPLPNDIKVAGNFTTNIATNISGKWQDGNSLKDTYRFAGNSKSNPCYEPFYLKRQGEMAGTYDREWVSSAMGGEGVVAVKLNNSLQTTDQMIDVNGNPFTVTGQNKSNKRNFRDARNENMVFLDADEASNQGLQTHIEHYEMNESHVMNPRTAKCLLSRKTEKRKGHHMSEITVYRPDGMRYVYGLPAYNTKQVEATFAIGDRQVNCSTGLTDYDSSDPNPNENKKGLDRFVNIVEMPAYAHSYLLTAIVSPDYVDVTGNGPSDDDLGSWVKFNYTSKTVKGNYYRWRMPYHGANYDEGIRADHAIDNKEFKDDKASYLYGEKEIWYLHSIESKNYISEFTYSIRNDGIGAIAEYTPRDTTAGSVSDWQQQPWNLSYKLDRIDLYGKRDRRTQGTNAIPLKSVHFRYDYSLCKGLDNYKKGLDPYESPIQSLGGKLTLKEVFFTHGSSKRGRLNSYKFDYNSLNPDYNIKGYDRWGSYKPVYDVTSPGNCNANVPNSPSWEFPYVDQFDAAKKAHAFSAAWTMTRIKLPSGGVINIEYESDDYAFVQDKHAMQMLKVFGSSSVPLQSGFDINKDLKNFLYDGGNYNYMYVEVDSALFDSMNGGHSTYFGTNYLRSILSDGGRMYFNFMVRLNEKEESYNMVPGYVEISKDEYGVTRASNGKYYGWVRLKDVPIGRDNDNCVNNCVNPISKSAWNFARLNAPGLVYPGNTKTGGPKEIILGLVGNFEAIAQLFRGANRMFRDKDYGIRFAKGRSYVRLYHPTGKKYGGGCRVKRLAISDEWNVMTGGSESTFSYGQEYTYTTKSHDGRSTISSGVATYEPMVGADENPLRQPIMYSESNLLAPDRAHYTEEPLGESHYPSPSVGYSKVTVTSLKRYATEGDPNSAQLNRRTATGSIEHEFYTAKDFPVIVENTSINKDNGTLRYSTNFENFLTGLLGLSFDRMAVSQGYKIELNDMHGKPKRMAYLNEAGSVYAYTENHYKLVKYSRADDGADTYKLVNEVSCINDKNQIEFIPVGLETEMVLDMRFAESQNWKIGAAVNLDVNSFLLPAPLPVPIVIPMPAVWPTLESEITSFRSAVATKIVSRYGIMDESVAFQDNSKVATQNLLWDKETGEVLLTRTQNEFDNWVYNFTYPAHWVYDEGMGASYKNTGAVFSDLNITGLGQLIDSREAPRYNFANCLVPGDELRIRGKEIRDGKLQDVDKKYWVIDVNSDSLRILDKDGQPPRQATNVFAKVLRSGRRNQQSTPVGTVQLLVDPRLNGQISIADPSREVLNASAVEFSDDWETYCCGIGTGCIDLCQSQQNPYTTGQKGNWRLSNTYTYLAQRRNAAAGLKTQKGGVFAEWTPFWKYENGWFGQPQVDQNWIKSESITKYDPYGNALESVDALSRYTTVQYGFNHTLQVAVAKNAAYREVVSESFEDKQYERKYGDGCTMRSHFGLAENAASSLLLNVPHISNRLAHSGTFSLHIPAGQKLTTGRRLNGCNGGASGTFSTSSTSSLFPPGGPGSECENCLPLFAPSAGKKYVLSAWTRESAFPTLDLKLDSRIKVTFVNNLNMVVGSVILSPEGQVIDGWQRISGTFTIPTNATAIIVDMLAPSDNAAFFDDLRIHPYDASIMTYVYDPLRLLLVAELDDRNYATFYEYDNQFNLTHVKKETEKGIQTLNETRSSLRKVQP